MLNSCGQAARESNYATPRNPGQTTQLFGLDLLGALVVRVVLLFELCRWNVAAGGVQPSAVEPVDPFQGFELDVVEVAPRSAATDQLGLVQADQRFGGRVVVGVCDAADTRHGAEFGQPLGVADR
jgi:hypothetical protein